MRRSKHSFWLPIAIAAAFMAVAAFGIVTYVNTMRIRASEQRVEDSYAIREAVHELLSSMKDAETGERGYLLTGEAAYLGPYHVGVQRAEERFAELELLVVNSPETEANVQSMRDAFEQQQSHFAMAIDLRKSQAAGRVSDEVLELVKSGRGKAAMDAARNAATKILDEQGDLLKEHEANTRILASVSQSTITAGHLIALALILSAGIAAYVDRQKRDQAEVALVREQDELAAVIDSAFEGILTFADDLVVRFINPAAARMYGLGRQEVVGRSILERVPVEQREQMRHRMLELNAEGKTEREFTNRLMLRGNGSCFPTEGTVVRVRSGEELFTTVKFRDMSEAVANQARQREFAAILEQINEAVLVCELDGQVRTCNDYAEKLLGITQDKAIGKYAYELLSVDRSEWLQQRERLLSSGLAVRDRPWTSPTGGQLILEERRSLIRDEEGQPAGKLVLLIDVTDQRREEAKERRSQRLESVGTLAGGVAHDLNNVLTPILMSAKLLKRGSKNAERLLDTIVLSAERGAKMIKKLLAFAGGENAGRHPVDLREVVLEAEDILSHTLPKTIDLQIKVPSRLPKIMADATELSQVVMNLAINARDAMPEGGRLEIEVNHFDGTTADAKHRGTLRAQSHVLLTVADNGEGIPLEIVDRVFDPFFTTKAQGKGTGLGLATVLGIVRSCGGDINVFSEPGMGTTFSIYLPVATEPLVSPQSKNAIALALGKGETILLVDDEPLIIDTARETLESNGYRVLSAPGGAEALTLWNAHKAEIDLVVLDMMMPGMDGIETKKALRNLNAHVKIVASSGLRRPESEGDKLSDVEGFLPKPYSDEQLLHAVRCAIDAEPRKT